METYPAKRSPAKTFALLEVAVGVVVVDAVAAMVD